MRATRGKCCGSCQWLAARIVRAGDLRRELTIDLEVDDEARKTWTRLGQ